MKLFWYDRGLCNQSSAIANLPEEDEVFMVFSPGLKHTEPNMTGNELWKVPLLHHLADSGHEITRGSTRRIEPSEERDFDLRRLRDMYPEYGAFVRDRDPMLDTAIWDIHKELEQEYIKEGVGDRINTADVIKKWLKEKPFGTGPDVDLALFIVMRSNPISALEQTYQIAMFLMRGIPVMLWDHDRQIAGTARSLMHGGLDWPHPLITVIAPYDVDNNWGVPELIDFPYTEHLETYTPIAEREYPGQVYCGNDYARDAEFAAYVFPQAAAGTPTWIWGKFDGPDGLDKQTKWPMVNWMGRVPANKVPRKLAQGLFTVNIVKNTYPKIGLITQRTFDSVCYGTLQMADGKIHRIGKYVPEDYIVRSEREAVELGQKILTYSDEEYRDELQKQRALVKTNTLEGYFFPRFDELMELALSKAGVAA